ncbi:primosomal protein [Agromyces sp. CCNWLW203]|uniref:primosomal protein n=1 Tax=Agromyces sp. CCNWLW203 TaxID=3112842 RepID=UPI002F967C98
MSDSKHGSADQGRPERREQRSGGNGADRPSGARSGSTARDGAPTKKPYGDRDAKKPYGDRDAKKPYGDRDAKKPYGDRDAKKPYGDRDAKKPYGDRDAKKPYGDRDAKKPYGDRGASKPYGDRDNRKPYGDRDAKPYGDRGASKPYGDRDNRKPYGDRDAKKPYGDRDNRKPYGDRDAKPYGDRGASKPYGDRDNRKPYGDRDAKPYGDRGAKPYGDRDNRKPYGDRDAKKPYGDRDNRKPYGDRDAKPYGDRGASKPYGDRDNRKPYGDRDAKKPYGDRDNRKPYGDAAPRGGRPGGRDDQRDAPPRENYGAAELQVRPRHDDPFIPESIEARDLDKGARAELKTLSKENADWVARHLVAASELLEDDPELAHQHALSAGRRAGRIAVVRETLAITAYATGDFALALRELRTYRRISGSNDQLPLLVDSERGVGRPDRALEVGRAVDRSTLAPAVQVGLAIAMSGARLDLGQPEIALAELEIPQLDPDRAFSYSPALFSAYAEVLEELGRTDEASKWRARADRAEAALGGPAEAESIEIFEVELEESAGDAEEAAPVEDAEEAVSVDEADESEASVAPEADAAAHEDAEEETEAEASVEPEADAVAHDDTGDEAFDGHPGDVLEDDVREVLAAIEADESEGTSGGTVPRED